MDFDFVLADLALFDKVEIPVADDELASGCISRKKGGLGCLNVGDLVLGRGHSVGNLDLWGACVGRLDEIEVSVVDI